MTEIIQQIWFPITAMLAVVVALVFALNQRARHRRQALRTPHVIVTPVAEGREDER